MQAFFYVISLLSPSDSNSLRKLTHFITPTQSLDTHFPLTPAVPLKQNSTILTFAARPNPKANVLTKHLA